MYMLAISDMCSDYGAVVIISIIKNIFDIFQVIVPILLIIGCIMSLIKMLLNPEEQKEKQNLKNRFIAIIIFVFLPLIINIVMGLVGENLTILSCFSEAETYQKDLNISNKYEVSFEKEGKKSLYPSIPLIEEKQTVTVNSNNFPYYNQGDYSYSYDGCTMQACGCGFCSLAMVLSYYTSNVVDPIATYNFIGTSAGGPIYDNSLYDARILSTYGITPEVLFSRNSDGTTESEKKAITTALDSGKVVILLIPDHYIVLVGSSNQIVVYDPGNRYNNGTYTIDEISTKYYNGLFGTSGISGFVYAVAYSK